MREPVAYQGIAGAFGEEALVAHFGEGAGRIGLATFGDVFDAVVAGRARAGVVPIENSLGGSILENYDLLLRRDVHIAAEVTVRVRHCLLAPPGASLADVTKARSHPQALAQCARFLETRRIAPVAATNTAIAAREVAASAARDEAAIASERAGRIYGLDVLATDIHDRAGNTTRFFVITASPAADDTANKASLAFTARNEPGSLLACLQAFADHGLNLTKLESRPTGEERWEYTFHVDLESPGGTPLDPTALGAVLSTLARRATHVRVFGLYRAGD